MLEDNTKIIFLKVLNLQVVNNISCFYGLLWITLYRQYPKGKGHGR